MFLPNSNPSQYSVLKNNYMLIIYYSFSKYMKTYPTKNI